MDISSHRSLCYFLVTCRDASIANVFTDVVIEKDGVLRNYTNVGSEGVLSHLQVNVIEIKNLITN